MSSSRELQNRKAHRDYQILETVEAGVELRGTEVKSLRTGECSINEAFARIENGQAWLHNFHIAPYDKGNRENHEPKRVRRLLLHKQQLAKLQAEITIAGKALVPLKGYFNQANRFKILLGLGKGKNVRDKRQDIKTRDVERDVRRAMTQGTRR